MEPVIPCLVCVLLVALLAPIILAFAHARKIKALESVVQKLTARLTSLESQPREAMAPSAVEPLVRPIESRPAPVTSVPPPLPAQIRAAAPPPASAVPTPPPPRFPTKPRAPIDWENFLGVKLFAWIGGFVLFLGVVFLVKYSFENNLITPMMRILMGAIVGFVLVGAGWFTARRNYRVPGQSLCATGVVILYADIFGAHAFYGLVSLGTAFFFMCLVTIGAFFLAVRLDAQVVVILGLLGGFLTPPMLSHHSDEPLRLFSYIALLNAGIAAVALRKRWNYLLVLAAAGTVLTQLAWLDHFYPSKAMAGFLIFLGFEAQFLLFAWLRLRISPPEKWSMPAACLTGASALGFAFILLDYSALATRPGYFFGFTFLADIGLLALALSRKNPARIAAPLAASSFSYSPAGRRFFCGTICFGGRLGPFFCSH